MKKKLSTCLLIIILSINIFGVALANDYQLKVATPNPITGNFFTNAWGNNTTDIDVRYLLHAYATVEILNQYEAEINKTVVEDFVIENTSLGKTYTFKINENLKWNDGSAITAKDYVFSLLLQSSKAFANIVDLPTDFSYILNAKEYQTEALNYCPGVRLIDDYSFSIIINEDFLPYFYELSLVQVYPYPAKAIAPNANIKDDGMGSYIEPKFDEDQLKETILNEQTGYLQQPKLSCGPYTLVDYNPQQKEASFKINPYYIGDYKGQKPSIETIKIVYMNGEEAVKALSRAKVDIVHKLVNGTDINNAKKIKNINSIIYPRQGYTLLSFNNNDPVVSSLAVRKAIAYGVDKKSFIDEHLKGYGTIVYSDYGMSQWQVAELAGAFSVTVPSRDRLSFKPYETLPFNKYSFNPKTAENELINDGWTLNKDGNPYRQGIRYKQTENGLQKLSLTWLVAEESSTTKILAKYLQRNLRNLGFELIIEKVPYQTLLQAARGTINKGSMYFWGTNFTETYSPFINNMDINKLSTETLKTLSADLIKTEEGDKEAYMKKWLDYQLEYNAQLPTVPIYSSTYADFYTNRLYNYNPSIYFSWAQAILYAQR